MIKKNRIKQLVLKAKLRLTFLKALNYMGFGLIIGVACSLFIALLSLAVPVVDEDIYVILAPVLGMISALIVALIFMPSAKEAALKTDKNANLKERITTAYEIIDNEDEVSLAVINDAYKYTEGIKLNSIFPMKIGLKKVGIFALLALMTFGVGLIETPAKDAAKRKEQIASTIREERDVIKQLEKEIKNNPELSEEEKKELLKTIKDGLNEMKEAKKDEDIKKAEQKLVKKLEQELNNVTNKDMLAKSLAKAAVDLNNKIPKDMKEQAKDQLAKKLDNIKKAEDEVKDLLDKANEAKKNGEIPKDLQKQLQEALKNAANELSSEELANLANQMNNSLTQEQLDQLASALKNASAEQMMANISNASFSISSANAFANNNNQNGQNNSNSSGNANGNSSSSGQGQGQGQGAGMGNGNGNG